MYGFRFGLVMVAALTALPARAADTVQSSYGTPPTAGTLTNVNIIPSVGSVDFTAPILDIDGEPLVECADKPIDIKPGEACKNYKPVTLGVITSRAMCAGEQNAQADEIFKRCQLGIQTAKSNAAVLSPEDKASFRKQISRVYGPQSGLIVLRAVTLIDPTPPK